MAGKGRIGIKIDMTPMVDIAFLLLIFYMTTTQFKPPEAKAVELPSSHSMIELPDKDVINITVTKYDSIYVDYVEKAVINIDGRDVNTSVRRVRTCDRYSVVPEIRRAQAQYISKQINPMVVVKADQRASFGVMKDVMDEMQKNDLGRFLIITDQEVEGTESL